MTKYRIIHGYKNITKQIKNDKLYKIGDILEADVWIASEGNYLEYGEVLDINTQKEEYYVKWDYKLEASWDSYRIIHEPSVRLSKAKTRNNRLNKLI